MISVRRLIASLLAGALLVLATAAQASAQPATDLDRAFEGVALGLAAASQVDGDGDVIVLDEVLLEALDAYEAWAAKFAESNGQGLGPENAAAVHQALLLGEAPGQLAKESGSKLAGLNGVYELIKGKSEEAKAAKEAKEKSNNGKSDDKSNNGKSDDASNNGRSDDDSSDDDDSTDKSESDKDASESSRGQQKRP